jgi:hypothetical protein
VSQTRFRLCFPLLLMLALLVAPAGLYAQADDARSRLLSPADLPPGFIVLRELSRDAGPGTTHHAVIYVQDPTQRIEGQPHQVTSELIVSPAPLTAAEIAAGDEGFLRRVSQIGAMERTDGPALGDQTIWLAGRAAATDTQVTLEVMAVGFQVDRYFASVMLIGYPGSVSAEALQQYALRMRERLP